MKESEIQALISLLDDPDPTVHEIVRNQLSQLGADVIPFLESAWESAFGSNQQDTIEEILRSIRLSKIKNELKAWKISKDQSLLEGALIIASYHYPELDRERFEKFVEQIKQDIWLELSPELTALETARIINHILFEVHGFKGNSENYSSASNSFINLVLESKKGNPVSLSLIYMELARRLNLPIYGVNLPQHFILAYLDKSGYYPFPDYREEQDVLFYINPFSRGTFFSRRDIDGFLKQLKLEPTLPFYNPCQPIDILTRILHNLLHSFEKEGNSAKVADLKELLDITMEK